MGSPLPSIPFPAFRDRFHRGLEGWRSGDASRTSSSAAPEIPSPDEHQVELLWTHYEEMRRWNPKLSLIGPGTAAEVVERHYVESWAGVALVSPSDRHLVDVGTGGGFPGLVLAVARPDIQVTLVEPKSRKVAFLEAALRRLARDGMAPDPPLRCRVLDARVDGSLPAGLAPPPSAPSRSESGVGSPVDVVTSRALAWSPAVRDPFLTAPPEIVSPALRFVLWTGREMPETGEGPARRLRPRRELRPRAGSVERRIVELRTEPRNEPATTDPSSA